MEPWAGSRLIPLKFNWICRSRNFWIAAVASSCYMSWVQRYELSLKLPNFLRYFYGLIVIYSLKCSLNHNDHGVGSSDHIQKSVIFIVIHYLFHLHFHLYFVYLEKWSLEPTPWSFKIFLLKSGLPRPQISFWYKEFNVIPLILFHIHRTNFFNSQRS